MRFLLTVTSRIYAHFVAKSTSVPKLGVGVKPILDMPRFRKRFLRQKLPSWPWLLGRQSPPRRRPSTLESLGFKLRGLLGFNPRGVKSIKRTLRLPTLRLPTIAPLRLISVAPLRLRCSTFSIIDMNQLSESTQMLFSSTFLQCWVRKVTKEIF